jgi:hypothetical protein
MMAGNDKYIIIIINLDNNKDYIIDGVFIYYIY